MEDSNGSIPVSQARDTFSQGIESRPEVLTEVGAETGALRLIPGRCSCRLRGRRLEDADARHSLPAAEVLIDPA